MTTDAVVAARNKLVNAVKAARRPTITLTMEPRPASGRAEPDQINWVCLIPKPDGTGGEFIAELDHRTIEAVESELGGPLLEGPNLFPIQEIESLAKALIREGVRVVKSPPST
jgi:hypothetical protein